MDEKYIELLLKKCTKIKTNQSLLIHYSKEIYPFIKKIIQKVKELKIEDIYLDEFDIYKDHEFLKEHTEKEIKESNYFNKKIWDTYAKKNANFLIFETEYPHLMDDIPPEKLALSAKIKRESRPIYRKMVERCELSWCIASYPGKLWAKDIYKEDNQEEKLKNAIYRMCMINTDNPIKSWDEFLNKQIKIQNYLNKLNLNKLIYQNSLGTNLEITLPENYQYSSALDNDIIVNMPSYEIFASPDYTKTKGIVYASKPLSYNGAIIEDFWLKFDKGKVVDYDAKIGKQILKEIIESDSNSCYLGECALVESKSPIAQENMNYGTTLIDENASCHLALGAGFAECIKDGLKLSDDELIKKGINISKNHVDFMIGTKDLKIEGITKEGEKILIFKEGNFEENILKEANKC